MKDYIYTIFQESGSLSTEEIFLHILVASILACVIYLSYYFTHAGGVYSKKIQRLTYHPDDSYGNGYDSYRQ